MCKYVDISGKWTGQSPNLDEHLHTYIQASELPSVGVKRLIVVLHEAGSYLVPGILVLLLLVHHSESPVNTLQRQRGSGDRQIDTETSTGGGEPKTAAIGCKQLWGVWLNAQRRPARIQRSEAFVKYAITRGGEPRSGTVVEPHWTHVGFVVCSPQKQPVSVRLH